MKKIENSKLMDVNGGWAVGFANDNNLYYIAGGNGVLVWGKIPNE